MGNVLVLPDIHGRLFWKDACKDIRGYDKVIFLGDYLDPYRFEKISVESAIENLKGIIELKKLNREKVILLLGNHDLPYYSQAYLHLNFAHSRYSYRHSVEIEQIFEENANLFMLAYHQDNILFTHAGVLRGWYIENLEGSDDDSLDEICQRINMLKENPRNLYLAGPYRGGYDAYSSCVWDDVHEMMEQEKKTKADEHPAPLMTLRQIFGHTLQVSLDTDGNHVFDKPVLGEYFMMLDTGSAYVVDTSSFKLI